ncbi:uncharacterized protein [Arachis hypogaea]|uniref:Hepatoma-derived growth factor-related protein 2-like n=1 Tax=Arachis hypogaea TaxID=3818 RepID=A0A444WVC0_ARAHY|nr:uncharacterized protein LOC112747566 [Arachis hypogaea]XP_025698087.1 uncharacterized protein LOC112800172 [Arachis hypogaea]QHO40181.1 uncharacterized protein DS421_5g135370 [Arachis hypogaea]RYQ81335.1 hypothetical protein Ahy_Scaffold1g107297 [Arachis hypogaea]
MVGFFSDLSDTDDSAIDDIISQANDACLLDQISAINCSSFTDSSILPSHLESRFRKLKSFPATTHRAAAGKPTTPLPDHSKDENFPISDSSRSFHQSAKAPVSSPSGKNKPNGKMALDPKLQQGCVSSPSDSVDSSYGRNGLKSKSKLGSISSGSGSSDGSEESSLSSMFKPAEKGNKNKVKVKNSGSASSPSPSPPRRAGCFWCSPKKDSRKKSKEVDWSVLGWDKDDELLSDLRSFSSKRQQKILKKALKEEQKISREAEKIVEWAKQESARMNVNVIDHELSDTD